MPADVTLGMVTDGLHLGTPRTIMDGMIPSTIPGMARGTTPGTMATILPIIIVTAIMDGGILITTAITGVVVVIHVIIQVLVIMGMWLVLAHMEYVQEVLQAILRVHLVDHV